MLTATELAALRTAQLSALTDTCSILSKTEASDSMGGRTETWATTASGVACRLSALEARGADVERIVAERFQGRTILALTLPYGQAVDHLDRILIRGTYYDVVLSRGGPAWETARRLIVARID